MNNFDLEEEICSSISNCFDINDPNHTRNVIDQLLNRDSRKLEILGLIVREMAVNTIHGCQGSQVPKSNNNSAIVQTSSREVQKQVDGKTSRLGTVSLPKVIDYVEDTEGSGSDIPSQSSASSDNEQTVDESAEEQWAQTLPTTASANSKHPSQKDFFQSLVKDLEGQQSEQAGDSKWRSFNSRMSIGESHMSAQDEKHVKVVEELSSSHAGHEVHLPHSHVLPASEAPGLEEQIQIAIRHALTMTDNYIAPGGSASKHDSRRSTVQFSLETLNEISRAVISHIGLKGTFAEQCEARINDTLIIFIGHTIHNDNCELLGAVVKSVIEKQLDKYKAVEELSVDDNDEEEDDNMSTPRRDTSTGVSRRQTSPLAAVIGSSESTVHFADQLYRQHEQDLAGLDDTDVFRYIQRTASHHLESNNSPVGSGDRKRADGPGEFLDQEDSVYEDSLEEEGEDEEEEEDYETAKGHHSFNDDEENDETVDRANPPAWLIPKSPLDSVFRQGYGGLGHPDLSDVVTRLEGSPAVLKPSRGYNDSSSSDSDDRYGADDNGDSDQDMPITVDDLPYRFGRHNGGSGSESPLQDLDIEEQDDGDDDDSDNVLGTDPDSRDRDDGDADDDSTVDNNVSSRYTRQREEHDDDDDASDSEDELQRRMDDSFNANTLLSFGLPNMKSHSSDLADEGHQIRKSIAAKAEAILANKQSKDDHANHPKKSSHRYGDNDDAVVFDLNDDGNARFDDAVPPSRYNTSTSLQYRKDGTVKLTGNNTLNTMMLASFKSYVDQYGQQQDSKNLKTEAVSKKKANDTGAGAVQSRFASLSPTVDYSFADLDDIISSNLAKLEALKSPGPKRQAATGAGGGGISGSGMDPNGRPATAASSQQLQARHEIKPSDRQSTVFSFAPDVSNGVSKSWSSPRHPSHYDNLEKASKLSKLSSSPLGKQSRQTKKKSKDSTATVAGLAKSATGVSSERATKEKKQLTIRLSSSSNPNLPSADTNPSKSSVNHRGVQQQKSKESVLSMDSSIESNDGYVLPGKSAGSKAGSRGDAMKRPASAPRRLSAVTSSTGSSNNVTSASAVRSKSPRHHSSSLLAPTVTATMRSLALAGGSNDVKVKHQSRLIQRSMDDVSPTAGGVKNKKVKKNSK